MNLQLDPCIAHLGRWLVLDLEHLELLFPVGGPDIIVGAVGVFGSAPAAAAAASSATSAEIESEIRLWFSYQWRKDRCVTCRYFYDPGFL